MQLPTPTDDFDRRLVADVRMYGWHCVLVATEHHAHHAAANAALPPDPVYDATFAYTVGLPLTYQHPELVLVGRWHQAHAILTSAVHLVTEEGLRLTPEVRCPYVLEGYDVMFKRVRPAAAEVYLTYSHWLNSRRPVDALQLVLPDRDGRWPWESGYDSQAQPLLNASVSAAQRPSELG